MHRSTEWEELVAQTYSDVVSEADPKEGISRQDAFEIAVERLTGAVRRGEIEIDLSRMVRLSLTREDEAQGKRADRLVADTVQGVLTLVDCDRDLNTVVTLGKGQRKLWRHINDDDLLRMDEVRYQNMRAAQDSYNAWRQNYAVVLQKLKSHRTVERAIAAGAFLDQAASAA